MIQRENRSHFLKFYFFGDFESILGPEKPQNDRNSPFFTLKTAQNPRKCKISKKWLLNPLHIIKLQFHGHFHGNWTKSNGEPELSLESFYEIPDLWDFPLYFAIFCEMYPNFVRPQKLNR